MLAWNPALAQPASQLEAELARVAPKDFVAAVEAELAERAELFARGIARYRDHPYRRELADPPVLWGDGTTRLLDYGPPDGRPLLVVPSLINRYHVLDLMPDRSLMRFLAGQGHRPLVVDWDEPGETERGFGLTDYIAGRLEAALNVALDAAGAPPAVLGYCMGGLLAVALAARRPRDVAALALLATPWDFHAERREQALLLGGLAEHLGATLAPLGVVPVDLLQALFATLDPLTAIRKFIKFATMAEDSPATRHFVALEDWVNDGVPLALPVARACLADWYEANAPARGAWRIAGTTVDAPAIACPALVIVPGRDRIVPPATAAALAALLPSGERLDPPLGHIGMVVGNSAPAAVWGPLEEWLARVRPAGRRTRRGSKWSRKKPS